MSMRMAASCCHPLQVMELPRGARMDAGAFVSSVSTGIKRCYCATEDSTNCAREERIPFAPMCGAATVSLGNLHLRKLVQYRGICRASRSYVRGCGTQFNLSAGHANAGSE